MAVASLELLSNCTVQYIFNIKMHYIKELSSERSINIRLHTITLCDCVHLRVVYNSTEQYCGAFFFNFFSFTRVKIKF